MSRNFDLLRKLGKDHDIVTPGPEASPPSQPEVSHSDQNVQFSETSVAPGLEEVHSLAQQVFFAGPESPRVVVLTSTEPGAGCTWVCARLAEGLASRGTASVCVVDANLRNPEIHRQFGVENERGLSDALPQPDPIRGFARQLSRPNLWLISGGTGGEGVAALLTSDRMRLRIGELRAEFDFVLMDSSAMSEGNDAICLGANADGVLLVLQANASRREVARQAVRALEGGEAKVLGAVLNRRTFPIPNSIYKRL